MTFKTLVLTGSKSVVSFSGLLLLMLLSRFMGEESYGGLRQLTTFGRMFLPLLLLGLPQALIYFIPKNSDAGRHYLRVAIMLFTAVVVCFAFLSLIFSEQISAYYKNPSMAEALPYIFPWVWAVGVLLICTNALVGSERPSLSGIIGVIHALVFVTGVAGVAFLGAEYGNVVKAYGVVPLLSVVPIVIFIYRSFPRMEVEQRHSWDIRGLLSYSIPLSLSQFIANFGRQVSLLIVAPLLLVEEFGVYANGAIELPLVGMLTGSAVAVITPEIVRLYSENRISECVILWQKAAEKTAIIIFPVFVFFMFNAEGFMALLFSEKYIAAAVPFRVFLLLLPMRIIYFGIVFIAAGRSRLILLRSIVTTVICALVTFVVARFYDPMYAPLGLVIAIYAWALPYNIYWYQRLMGVSFSKTFAWRRVSKLMVISLALSVTFLPAYCLRLEGHLALIINALVYFGVYMLVLRGKLSV